jgi:hypothetical protein
MSSKGRIGTVVTNIQGHHAKVVGFKDSMYELETIGGAYSHPVFVHPANFRMNKWKHRTVPDVKGVGYHGYGIYDTSDDFYQHWAAMMTRCYSSSYQTRQPTYKGCSVDSRWFDYQVFCQDCADMPFSKENYNGVSYHLDKDILVPENKTYSKYTCCFVPSVVNSFFKLREVPCGYFNVKRHKTKVHYMDRYCTREQVSSLFHAARADKANKLISEFTGLVDQRVIDRLT